jgi:multidrug resistance efflux pump
MDRFAESRTLSTRRNGSTLTYLIGGLGCLAVLVAAIIFFLRGDDDDPQSAPLLSQVTRGPYEHEVLEQGDVESSNNVELRCEVRARNANSGPSTSIIDVVREGTRVKKGDWLVTFDSSALEQELGTQRIAVNTIEALVIQAKATYDTALIARTEYLEGTYREQEKTIQNQIFVAEETLKKAQLSHDSIKRLVSRGLLSSLQLEGERFRVDAAQNDLDLAKRRLEVLEKYTKEKMLTQLNSDAQAAEVRWRNEQGSYQEELKKLKDIEDQVAKCKVYAPQDGQVVYANITSSRSGSEFVVEPGAMVRENQVVIRLPDPTSMQVKAKVSESRINLVKEGMPVSIRIDAFGDSVLEGSVIRVNKYAEPGNWFSSSIKEYATFIQIHDPPLSLRVGLTAEVRIHVESRADALQVPVQAIYDRGGQTFCLVQNGTDWDTREVVISSTNEKTAAIDEEKSEPLQPGERIVMNPRKHLALFDASRLPKEVVEPKRIPGAGEPAKEQVAQDGPAAQSPVAQSPAAQLPAAQSDGSAEEEQSETVAGESAAAGDSAAPRENTASLNQNGDAEQPSAPTQQGAQ